MIKIKKIKEKISSLSGFSVSVIFHVALVLILLLFVLKKVNVEEETEVQLIILPNPSASSAAASSALVSEDKPTEPTESTPTETTEAKSESTPITQVPKKEISEAKNEASAVMNNITSTTKTTFIVKTSVNIKDISHTLKNNFKTTRVSIDGSRNPNVTRGEGLSKIISDRGATVDRVDIRVTLSWSNSNDLDLLISGPQGNLDFKSKILGTGVLENDAEGIIFNDQTSQERRFENAYWAYDQAPEGEYAVYASIYDYRLNNSAKTFFTVEVASKSNNYTIKGNLSPDYGESSVIQIATFSYKAGDIVNFKTTYTEKVIDLRPDLKDTPIPLDIH